MKGMKGIRPETFFSRQDAKGAKESKKTHNQNRVFGLDQFVGADQRVRPDCMGELENRADT